MLIEHEAVAEAAVVPSPDPLRLAVPKAYVVLAPGHEPTRETALAILRYARERLAPYKRIRRLEFSELPKTISGKIRRVELRGRGATRAPPAAPTRPSADRWSSARRTSRSSSAHDGGSTREHHPPPHVPRGRRLAADGQRDEPDGHQLADVVRGDAGLGSRCARTTSSASSTAFPRFRQLARPGGTLSGPHWEDDPHFDPKTHFHRIALPAPHDRDALRELVGDLATAPLDHGRPLWEVYLIEDFGSGAAVLTRVHHAVADGIALARVMLSATDGGDPGPGIGDVEPHSLRRSARCSTTGSAPLRHPRRRRRAA